MEEPLLSSLCTICHIDEPKYTCPRCSVQTCSLRCSKRHKLWSDCNGIRDPTVFKPISEVATASGIDHDYNFIHGIETRIARSEKLLIEDLGIIDAKDLQRARAGEDEDIFSGRKRNNEPPGEVQFAGMLKKWDIRVVKAPKGMRRNKENTTNWNRTHRSANWQVEWLREGAERMLHRVVGSKPIGCAYEAVVDEERRLNMSPQEKAAQRIEKRKGRTRGAMQSAAKRARLDGLDLADLTTVPILQNSDTSTWDFTPVYPILDAMAQVSSSPPPNPKPCNYHLYLHRPLTPASFPKVLIPLDPSLPLNNHLRNRDVLEFPTIYVLDSGPNIVPSNFMLEKDYLTAIGQPQVNDTTMGGMTQESQEGRETSSDGATENSELEEGEIL
jgi:hypothetical protein